MKSIFRNEIIFKCQVAFLKIFGKYFQVFGCDHEYAREREKEKKEEEKGGRGFHNEVENKRFKKKKG